MGGGGEKKSRSGRQSELVGAEALTEGTSSGASD